MDAGTLADAGIITGNGDHRGIQDVARELGITPRTLRFYEDNGLISPQRVGSTRIYSRRDVGRMQLILRGKRLGFTIREIREFLDLYDTDPSHREQMEHLLTRVRERLDSLMQQRAALEETMAELRQIEAEALERIAGKGLRKTG
ncbi:MerR family transcriptional regulator [Alteraurantiacibacter palmitatis]|uniref:MerR family DNA-binding transcriptional regulator n=1 Tax=Alteraurantiacibacter palmitatis TaxID=2054628 RepID=A0ABV7EBH8_9SPHN